MRKSVAIKLLKKHCDILDKGAYLQDSYEVILFVMERCFGCDSPRYKFVSERSIDKVSVSQSDRSFDIDVASKKIYYARWEIVDFVRACLPVIKLHGMYKSPKKNIFSNKDNTAVLLAGLGVFFVGILVGSQLRPEVVSLLERIRNIFV